MSEGPFASLNVSVSVGDVPARVAENVRRISQQVGCSPERLATVSQVHGKRVVDAVSERTGAGCEADALFTASPEEAVGVKTADCVPILLVDPDQRRVAAVHSGWKGTELEIAGEAVRELARKGGRPERLLAAIGPSIRLCCYEVSEELALRFTDRFGLEVVAREEGRPHLDLVRAIRLTLERCGLKPDHVDVLPDCTACEPEHFFSHRRDRGVTGRHLNLAVCRF